MVSRREARPMRTLSYRSLPWPCTRRLRRFGQGVVVGQHRAAVAVAAKRLGREKAGRGGVAESAEPAAIEGRAEGLRGVVEHEQVGVLGNRGDGVVVGRQAEQVDRDDRLRRQAYALGGRQRGFKPFGVDVETFRLDVDEDRRGADQRHHFRGGAEGEGRAETPRRPAQCPWPSAPVAARRCRWRR